VTIVSDVAPGSIKINTTSQTAYFTFTNADITGACAISQGGGGSVLFAGRKQWSFGGGVVVSNGLLIFSPPGLASDDNCHFGTNAIRLQGTSSNVCGMFRYTANTTAARTGVDQDFVIRGVGVFQTHQAGNTDASLAKGHTVRLEGDGPTVLYLEDYTGGGNGGWMVIASNGTIRLAGGDNVSREICLRSFSGNAYGFSLGGALMAESGFTNRLILRNATPKLFVVAADNTGYSNGFEIAWGVGPVGMNSSAAWGSSDASAARTLIGPGGYLSLRYAFSSADLLRIDPASSGILGIDASTAANMDLSPSGLNAPNLLIGGSSEAVYTGTITPYGSVYRFSGWGRGSDPYIGSLQIGDGLPARDNLLTGARSVTVEGSPANTWIFRLQVRNSNNYTGGTVVKRRGLLSIGCTGGTPFGSGLVEVWPGGLLGAAGTNGTFWNGTAQFTNYILYAGASLVLDENYGGGAQNYNGSNGGQGRWGDEAPIALDAGTLSLVAGKNNTWTERVGVVSFGGGGCVLSFTTGGGTSRYFLDASNMVREGRATLRVTASLGSAFRVRYRVSPQLGVNGLLSPFIADGSGKNFLTYTNAGDSLGATGVMAVVYTRTGATALNDPPLPTDIVNQTADLTLNNSPTVYALKTSALGGSAYTVTITSGALILIGNNKTHSANFNFGSAEAVVWLLDGYHTLNGTLTGESGLTKAGLASLYLAGNSATTLRGPITVNEGLLQLNHTTTLGQTNDVYVAYGATLNLNAQTTLSVGNLGGHGAISVGNRTLKVCGVLNPGSDRSPGSLLITGSGGGTLEFQSGASMRFGLAGLSRISDQVVVSNATVNLNGVAVTVDNIGGLEPGVYTLIDITTGTLSGSPGSLTMPEGFGGVLSVATGDLTLEVRKKGAGTVFVAR